jgi:predicted AAA+ superfamily ATPase
MRKAKTPAKRIPARTVLRARPKSASPAARPAPDTLDRIAAALERLSPARDPKPDFRAADAFVWHADGSVLVPVKRVNRVDLGLLKGIDRMRDTLIENTERFASALPANNALLWGARGMGKSSLVKAAHASVNAASRKPGQLKLIEIHREDIESLPVLMAMLREAPFRFIVFCDDLSFDGDDTSYKSLKAVLEGGIEGRPENVILYATSNRRHLMSRDMMENELDRDQSRRSGRGEGVAVRPVRALARLPQMQPGRIPRHGGRLCEAFPDSHRAGRVAARGAGMVDHARRPFGPGGVAIHPGLCRAQGRAAVIAMVIPGHAHQRANLETRRALWVDSGFATSSRPGMTSSNQLAPVRNCIGSTGVAPLRISKCNCGDATLPVWPDFAMVCPRFTLSPRFTSNSLTCA